MTTSKSQRLRSLRSKASANRRWALSTPQERKDSTATAQERYWLKLEAEVDPEGLLSEEERRVRAIQLWKAKMQDAKADRLAKRRVA